MTLNEYVYLQAIYSEHFPCISYMCAEYCHILAIQVHLPSDILTVYPISVCRYERVSTMK
jgi:hypothetical protein